MERLTIDEIIAHCKRQTDGLERRMSAEQYETADMLNFFVQEYWEHRQVAEYLEELKEYRKAEEQGLLLRLPCKVGDTVYSYCEYNGNVMEYEILNIHISSYASGGYDIAIEGVTEDDEGEEYEFCLSVREFKNECFASREEAKAALAEKGGV